MYIYIYIYIHTCVPRACVSMLLQFHDAQTNNYFPKEAFSFTKPLLSGTGASKLLPIFTLELPVRV